MKQRKKNEMKNMDSLKEKGITLISLAVTVLVMLILAGVVLSTTVRK